LFSGAAAVDIGPEGDSPVMKYEASSFRGNRAWSGPDIASIRDATVKLRWADQPFRWHVNEGPEVFVVLSGGVDMHVRGAGLGERIIHLGPGDLLHIEPGEEHVAHPRGEARILVIEEARA
jgi:mannose-6-phosphate isomerase-like protein (cupin superfamily)